MALRRAFDNSLRLKGVPEEKLKWHRMWVRRFLTAFFLKSLFPCGNKRMSGSFSTASNPAVAFPPGRKNRLRSLFAFFMRSFSHAPGRRSGRPLQLYPAETPTKGELFPGRHPLPPALPKRKVPALLWRGSGENFVSATTLSEPKRSIFTGWAGFSPWRRDRPGREEKAAAVRSFLEDLAIRGKVAAGTQRQALNAVAFYFHKVEGVPHGGPRGFYLRQEPS